MFGPLFVVCLLDIRLVRSNTPEVEKNVPCSKFDDLVKPPTSFSTRGRDVDDDVDDATTTSGSLLSGLNISASSSTLAAVVLSNDDIQPRRRRQRRRRRRRKSSRSWDASTSATDRATMMMIASGGNWTFARRRDIVVVVASTFDPSWHDARSLSIGDDRKQVAASPPPQWLSSNDDEGPRTTQTTTVMKTATILGGVVGSSGLPTVDARRSSLGHSRSTMISSFLISKQRRLRRHHEGGLRNGSPSNGAVRGSSIPVGDILSIADSTSSSTSKLTGVARRGTAHRGGALLVGHRLSTVDRVADGRSRKNERPAKSRVAGNDQRGSSKATFRTSTYDDAAVSRLLDRYLPAAAVADKLSADHRTQRVIKFFDADYPGTPHPSLEPVHGRHSRRGVDGVDDEILSSFVVGHRRRQRSVGRRRRRSRRLQAPSAVGEASGPLRRVRRRVPRPVTAAPGLLQQARDWLTSDVSHDVKKVGARLGLNGEEILSTQEDLRYDFLDYYECLEKSMRLQVDTVDKPVIRLRVFMSQELDTLTLKCKAWLVSELLRYSTDLGFHIGLMLKTSNQLSHKC